MFCLLGRLIKLFKKIYKKVLTLLFMFDNIALGQGKPRHERRRRAGAEDAKGTGRNEGERKDGPDERKEVRKRR